MSDIPAVETRGVSKHFGQGSHATAAVDGVSLAIRANEFFTLLGPSGCGKTTLLRLIAGFEFPTSGSIFLHGQDITAKPPFQRPVNTVFQNYALFPHLSVAENIGFGLKMLGRPKAEIAERVAQMLKLVRMEQFGARQISQVSGGQQQRVALARALAPQPKLLLLDEPLSALDFKLRKDMQVELKRMQAETGITFIFVTHDQEEALTMSDRVAVMSQGRILQTGSPRDIYDAPATRFVADFIGDTNFLTGKVTALAAGEVTVDLDCGGRATVPASGAQAGQQVTLVLRPEHARLAPLADAQLSGTLSNIVYFGTDTHFHITLADGQNFTLRQQNHPGTRGQHAVGGHAGITFERGAARLIED